VELRVSLVLRRSLQMFQEMFFVTVVDFMTKRVKTVIQKDSPARLLRPQVI